ncbi:MAG TPA: hypothetical protein VNG33_21865 [Polyangiaceae bacterium]|nr:hypothetical protein [Polyangiaceae bacterium]
MTEAPPIDIQWEAPAECPDAEGLRAAIERLLGKKLASLPGRDLRALGKVQRSEAGNWQLDVVLAVGGHVEQETLVAKKCGALGDAMALKVALAIDPLAVVDAVQSPSAPSSTAQHEQQSDRLAPVVSPATSLRAGLRLVGGVGLGQLPGVTPGAALYGSLQFPAFRVELGGGAFWGGVARYAAPANVGADLQLFVGAARGCVTPGSGRWLFPICGGVELGLMHGRGFGVETASSTSGLWGGVVIGPAVQFRTTQRLSLWLEADATLTVLRPEFHMRNLETLYAPAPGGSRACAGIEVNF